MTRHTPSREGFEALYCPGMPVDCCDYGVLAHHTGLEVCRVWLEEDARKITALLTLEREFETQASRLDRIRNDGGPLTDSDKSVLRDIAELMRTAVPTGDIV